MNFPSLFVVIEAEKPNLTDDKLNTILEGVIMEICKHVGEKTSHTHDYEEYEDCEAIDEKIWREMEPYDDEMDYVYMMRSSLLKTLEVDMPVKMEIVQQEKVQTSPQNFVSFSPVVSPVKDDSSEMKTAPLSQTSKPQTPAKRMRENYNKEVAESIDKLYDSYSRDFSLHPKYKAEWQVFYVHNHCWIKREDLPAAWKEHWIKRMKELKVQEFREKMAAASCKELANDECQQDDSDSDCELIETVRETIDVSDDGPNEEPEDEPVVEPKRQRFDDPKEVKKTSLCLKEQSSTRVTTEVERMVIAINIAKQLLREGKQVSPKDLIILVHNHLDMQNTKSYRQQEEDSTYSNLSNSDLAILIKNYQSLNPDEQDKLTRALKVIAEKAPDRYDIIISQV